MIDSLASIYADTTSHLQGTPDLQLNPGKLSPNRNYFNILFPLIFKFSGAFHARGFL